MYCCLLDFVSSIACTDFLFSQSAQIIHFTSCQNLHKTDKKLNMSPKFIMSILCSHFFLQNTSLYNTHFDLLHYSYHWLHLCNCHYVITTICVKRKGGKLQPLFGKDVAPPFLISRFNKIPKGVTFCWPFTTEFWADQ